ncbi:MAG: SIS domain-containing protein [Syntrophomonadaceae bacterium]|nr:SIS domain-containing protein [Syntrophomonadaceae bacterium]
MIKVLLLDIDGVMTNGKVSIDESGKQSKQIDFQDIDAVFKAKREGLKVGFISGEDGSIVEYFDHRFEPDVFVKGCKDKKGTVESILSELGMHPESLAYVGDSYHDQAVIKLAGLGMCPANATDDTKMISDHVLSRKGGDGAVREAILYILDSNRRESEVPPMNAIDISDCLSVDEILNQHYQMIDAMLMDQQLKSTVMNVSNIIVDALKAGNQVLFCGNGGSASDAQHLATELVSRFYHDRQALSAEALTTNTSSLTAIANDYVFDQVFSRQVEARGRAGDVLIGLTTSGNSVNVIKALRAAKARDMITVAMTGGHSATDIEKVADITIKVPSRLTPRIQEGHILVGHLICELVERAIL